MKYLLDEQEYQALLARAHRVESKHTEELQKFCTMVANTLPIRFWGRVEASPWGCILAEGEGRSDYCDECPAKRVCPHQHKEWSK